MTQYTSELLNLLASRGYIHQVTDASALDALAATQIVPGYIGFDATAPSLHVGNLVSIMLLRRCNRPGTSPLS
jgi:tyrosyl-tRNA synthetase